MTIAADGNHFIFVYDWGENGNQFSGMEYRW